MIVPALRGGGRRRRAKTTPAGECTVTQYRYNSADNHLDLVWTPRNVWQDRVAARFKDRAPRVVESEKGTYWEWEGKLQLPSADGNDNAKHRAGRYDKRNIDTPD